ncbi:MAG: hypothetical protein IJL14_09645 [Selenomonadaceae bacterium]|nr:hypothetical protein [Selenomonadaceae bacterium]MBQ6006493.1 hypothetical protein [Selenomonadaceae bacterium]
MFNEKNSGNVGEIIEVVQDIFQEVSKNLNRVGFYVSLEELQGRYDDALKKIILDEERERNCRYISGEFKISALDEKNYQCSYALYFEDADESYHVLEAQTKPLDLNCLTEDFRAELLQGVMSFEIEK